MAAKRKLTCEVLATLKGLDPKKSDEYTFPGTADNPTLVELDDTTATSDMIASKVIRIWPGPTEPSVPESAKIKALQEENAKLLDELAACRKDQLAAEAESTKLVELLRSLLNMEDPAAVKTAVSEALK